MSARGRALAGRLVRLTRQPWRRQRLVLEAALVLARMKTLLTFVPYARWQHLVEVSSGGEAGSLARDELEDVLWAVDRVGRTAPRQLHCLPRALAARQMLQRRGARPALCIGVMRSTEGQLQAHAWLEVDGVVVLGALPDLDRFQRLQRWPSGAAVTDPPDGSEPRGNRDEGEAP